MAKRRKTTMAPVDVPEFPTVSGYSRRLDDLMPQAQQKCRDWLAACQAEGVTVLVYCTFRGPEVQHALWQEGREIPGKNWRGFSGFGRGFYSTMADAWESWHQYRVAWDAVPMIGGKPDWTCADVNVDRVPDEAWWRIMAEQAERLGIEWAGHWQSFREYVHFQVTGGLDRRSLRVLLDPSWDPDGDVTA